MGIPVPAINWRVSSIAICRRRRFVADHFHDLPGFQEARHGHNWELEAEVLDRDASAGHPSERVGERLEALLDRWIQAVDYTLLNDQSALEGRNPTAEALAEWAFGHLEANGLEPRRVKVREKANYWAACGRTQA